MLRHENIKSFVCEKGCDKTFLTQKGLKVHQAKKHPKKHSINKLFKKGLRSYKNLPNFNKFITLHENQKKNK